MPTKLTKPLVRVLPVQDPETGKPLVIRISPDGLIDLKRFREKGWKNTQLSVGHLWRRCRGELF